MLLIAWDCFIHPIRCKHKPTCNRCRHKETPGSISYHQFMQTQAERFWYRAETARIKETFKPADLASYIQEEGILMRQSRFNETKAPPRSTTQISSFFDADNLRSPLPVVLSDSPLLYAYAMHIHLTLRPHAGVDSTCLLYTSPSPRD